MDNNKNVVANNDSDSESYSIPSDEADVSGVLLDERYCIIEPIGEGAGSRVYKAEHRLLNEIVAIKILKQHLLGNQTAIERFKREAKLALRLDHKNIIKLRAFGISPGGEPFIVMEYCRGSTLEEHLQKGRLSCPAAVSLGRQIAEALRYAHDKGIVHRDLKPGNIFLSREDDAVKDTFLARLLDFGLAKEMTAAPPQGSCREGALTQAGVILGTPAYMSPEQCRLQAVDARSDIYSLGCVLYECITGRQPFQADGELAVMERQLHDEPSFQSGDKIDGRLKAVILKCLHKEPGHRYQNAAELLKALQDSAVPPASNAAPVIAIAVLVVVLLLAILFAGDAFSIPGSLSRQFSGFLFGQSKNSPELAAENSRSRQKLKPLGKKLEDVEDLLQQAHRAKRGTPNSKPDKARAEELFLRARQLTKEQNESGVAAKCLIELAELYSEEEKDEKSRATFLLAISELKSLPSHRVLLIDAYRFLAYLERRHDLVSALHYEQDALNLCSQDERFKFITRREIACTLLKMGKGVEAEKVVLGSKKELGSCDQNDQDVVKETALHEALLLKIELTLGEYGQVDRHVNSMIAVSGRWNSTSLATDYLESCSDLLEKERYSAARRLAAATMDLPAADEYKLKAQRKEAKRVIDICDRAPR